MCPTCHQMAAVDYQTQESWRWLKWLAIGLTVLLLVLQAFEPFWFWFLILTVPFCFVNAWTHVERFRQCQSCGYRWPV